MMFRCSAVQCRTPGCWPLLFWAFVTTGTVTACTIKGIHNVIFILSESRQSSIIMNMDKFRDLIISEVQGD
jgi:hypothetical protein